MKRAKVSELKSRLSAFLADVRRGETVIVCDRNTPIARLVPIEEDRDGFRIEPASRPAEDLRGLRAVELRRQVDLEALLRNSRDQR